MTLIVEYGTVVNDANSYVTLAEANAALEEDIAIGSAAWNLLDDEVREELLIQATKFLEIRYRWYGTTTVVGQSLNWPRSKNFDDLGDIIPPGTIPDQLKDAQIEIARNYSTDLDEVTNIVNGSGIPKSWSTDGLSISFDNQALDSKEGGKGEGILMGTRYVDLEFRLRSIGTWKDLNWLQVTKQTVVRKPQ